MDLENLLPFLPLPFMALVFFILWKLWRQGRAQCQQFIYSNPTPLLRTSSMGGYVNGLRYRGLPFRVLVFSNALIAVNTLIRKEDIVSAEKETGFLKSGNIKIVYRDSPTTKEKTLWLNIGKADDFLKALNI